MGGLGTWLGWLVDGGLALYVLAKTGERIGWAFYRRHMRRAERKCQIREHARIELATAMVRWQAAQVELVTSLHQHAHTMAGMTGQPYLVSRDYLRTYDINVPELSVPCGQAGGNTTFHYTDGVIIAAGSGGGLLRGPCDDPRHYPWTLPPS